MLAEGAKRQLLRVRTEIPPAGFSRKVIVWQAMLNTMKKSQHDKRYHAFLTEDSW
jgi:hypothetical protein